MRVCYQRRQRPECQSHSECRDMRQLAAYNSTRYSHVHLCTVITPNIATVVITKVRTIHAKTIHGPPPALKISSFSRRPELDRVRRPELNEVSGSSSESSMSSNSSSELSITCALCLPGAAEWRRGTMKTAFYKSQSSLKFHNQKRELRQTKKRNPSSINGRVPFLEEFTKGLIRRGSGRPAGSRAERDEDSQSSVYMYHVYM